MPQKVYPEAEASSVSSDPHDFDWRCSCRQTNPDCEDRCRNCGEERFPNEEEDDSLSNLYSDESHRMQQAQGLKR